MSRLNISLCLSITVLVMAVCDPLRAADDQVRVVQASALGQWWQAVPGHPNPLPQYPVDALQEGVTGCVAVAFEIHGDGSVSNERIWNSALTHAHSSKQLEQAILQTVHQWRFDPTTTNMGHDPVYTYQTLTFTITEPSPSHWTVNIFINKPTTVDNRRIEPQTDELQAKCEMPDFAQQVQATINAGAQAHPSSGSS
ncbi:MAG TPA: energy transducer TonB [Rhodanobacteraceae bacterium]|nr:energy transducer TonB [Rhodanobacteraceae bacterium]